MLAKFLNPNSNWPNYYLFQDEDDILEPDERIVQVHNQTLISMHALYFPPPSFARYHRVLKDIARS